MGEVSIITIGDELLSGHTVDTNAVYIGRRLVDMGHTVRRMVTVGDSARDIAAGLKRALKSDVIITTGGLGTTIDDITKQSVTDALGTKLVGEAIPLANPAGTAPGIFIEEGKTLIFLLPGVPREMKLIFENQVVPLLRQRLASHSLITVTFHTTGIPESRIQELISEIGDTAFLPHHTGVDLRISRKTKGEMEELRKFLKRRLGEALYGEDDDTLEVVVGKLLKSGHLTIGVAESLTGGLVMHRITNVSGSSEYFLGGVVAYSNELKSAILGVKGETLKRYGAVSRQTALEMADGIRKATGADIGASTTGIAGPTGGTEKKPVGLIYTAVCGRGGAKCKRNLFKGDRLMIKEMSAQKVLDMVRLYVRAIHTP